MIKQAFLNIRSQKLISVIILSSIIAGVASIYILFFIKNMLSYQLKEQLSQLGEHNMVATFIPEAGVINLHPILQYEKIKTYSAEQTSYTILPYSVIGAELIFENQKYAAMLLAVGNNWSVLNIQLLHGRAFSEKNGNTKVVLIGKALAQSICQDINTLIGEYIQYQDQLLKIIGIYEQTGANLLDEQLESSALITYPLALRLTEQILLDHLYIIPKKHQNKKFLINKLTDFYQKNMGAGTFHIKDADFILTQIKAQFAQIEWILRWVCAIALGVGSLLLMQLFLLSLDKRRFEIGIRLACGAGPKEILIQFIQESSLYYLIGGGLGIVLGIILLVAWLLTHSVHWSLLSFFTALWPVMSAITLMAVLIGLIPGIRALSLPPMAFFKPGI